MIKFAKVINEQMGLCNVGVGTNVDFYKSIGMSELDVQQSDIDNKWYLKEKCPMKSEAEKDKERQQEISMLSLTSADVERGIYKATGKDFDDVVAMVEAVIASGNEAIQIDIKALKIELKANNFYRGNPYVDSIGMLLGFTKEQLDQFFETNDYTKLLKVEE